MVLCLQELNNLQHNNEQGEQSGNLHNNAFIGRYYLLQPDGSLQQVVYKSPQTEEQTNRRFNANFVLQNVQPVQEPIFSYNAVAPLIRLNK